MRVARGGEQAYRRDVVQHLKGDGAFGRVAFHSLHAKYGATFGFLVVEVVLSVIDVLAVGGLGAEDVNRHAVDGGAHVYGRKAVAALLVLVSLGRGQQPEFLHDIVEQLGAAGVQ